MPFSQGQAVEVPGTAEYLGDLPQAIEWNSDFNPFHTMEGLLRQRVGWIPAPAGVGMSSPAVLFEGIPYPFASSGILNWMPAFHDLELLNFPASAWWGPSAARGAIQIRLPDLTIPMAPTLGVWGGPEGAGGGEGRYLENDFYAAGKIQHDFPGEGNPTDTFNFISGVQWARTESFDVRTGFLGSQWLQGDDWYSFYGSFKWEGPEFQSVELKPFFQTATTHGVSVQEVGGFLNYHFSMAGVVESQVGLGMSHDDFSQGFLYPMLNKGYAQNDDVIDVLGDFKLNAAFRWDFSSEFDTTFNVTAGAQYRMDDFLLLGSYSKSRDTELLEDVQQGDLGFRYQPSDTLSATFKYVYEQAGGTSWNGSREKIQWYPSGAVFFLFQKTRLDLEEQTLVDQQGVVTFDTGARFQWSFFEPIFFRLGGRGISGQEFLAEGGADWLMGPQGKIYISVENISNFPVSWPDPLTPTGRVVWLGGELRF